MSDELKACPLADYKSVAEQLHQLGWKAPNDAQWASLKMWCDSITIDWDLRELSRDAMQLHAKESESRLKIAVEALDKIDNGVGPYADCDIAREALAKIRST